MTGFNITPLNSSLEPALTEKINLKTKPLGALGKLEKLALQIGKIQNTLSPVLTKPTIVVFAGDHGIAREGVSPFPQEVTWQMVYNFLQGGAGINVFARQHQIVIKVVDAGVNYTFAPHPDLIDLKVAPGTQSYLHSPAMSAAECDTAISRAAVLVEQLHKEGCNVIGFGEMGIGNTSSAAMLMSLLCNLPLEQCIGRGTGLDDKGLEKKKAILSEAMRTQAPADKSPLEILRTFGGFEVAMICGAMLKAAELKMVLLVDGFITTAALLVASALHPAILDYCVFAHQSNEQGHQQLLAYLKADPLLHLGMRLGEGTGAAVAYPVVQSAVAFLNEMASFASAGVSNKD
ncbi:nicotinate-nucleotide--dimethylbenzimidazole phosphoribosyltransferase [Chitinophaga silvisoli]|uniref:Nicotinate-nucleotide--dimethylbenzimidazole phosphoribosyltransferase n=1 Tax=Chitinophaga silvisoli TaxID=2291814 RepID=A0A3E1NYF9_9BACT|nr:nicotinate-nucleotide--dimethylbenzimidazole phosphoribosyltransferase [Chitinophaga silvisoli]RFM32960.1 nicotinate-nucleotide--dimethylbenzimidazole phosphoribosyltransferase [Chitinophaga silvisoli]